MHDENSYCQWLLNTLIPDLRESGNHATANSFVFAAAFILDAASEIDTCMSDDDAKRLEDDLWALIN